MPKRSTLLLIATLLIPICGCAGIQRWWENGLLLGPSYRRPVVNTASDWIDGEDPSVIYAPQQFHDWWNVFDDPAIDQLVQSAYQQNLPLRVAGLRVLEARTQRQITAANLAPQSQSLFGQFSRIQNSQNNAIPLPVRAFDDWQAGFDLSWEIDVWGRIRRAIEASDAAIEAETENYDDILVTLIGDVAATYIEIRAIDERLRLAEANVAAQAESLRIAEIRLKEEDVSELDVQQATANVTATRSTIPALRQARRQALNRMAILLGITPLELEPILRKTGRIPNAPDEVVVGIPADLLRRRPDIRRAEREIAIQSAQIGIAEAELYPQFGLNGQIGLRAEDFDDLFSSGSTVGAVAPGFGWKILNYGRLKNAVEVEALRFEQTVVKYEDTVLNAHREVEDAMAQFLRSKEQAAELQKTVDATERAAELVQIQYREGETGFNQVFVVESSLATTQDQLVVAQANVAIGLVQVYKALGGGWQLRYRNRYVGSSSLASLDRRPDVPVELPFLPLTPDEFAIREDENDDHELGEAPVSHIELNRTEHMK